MPGQFLCVLWWKNWLLDRFLAEYIRTPLIRINCDGKASEYAGNPDNWIFLGK
jgi:hypothetical protein